MRPELVEVLRFRLRKANHDLEAARRIMVVPENCPVDTVCFHCQQAVEKYLKLLLTFLEIPAPRSHDLEVLFTLLPDQHRLAIPLTALVELNPYAVQVRYAEDWHDMDIQEAQRAYSTAERVRREVLNILPSELQD